MHLSVVNLSPQMFSNYPYICMDIHPFESSGKDFQDIPKPIGEVKVLF